MGLTNEGIVSGENGNVYRPSPAEVAMAARDKEPHQPEPWTQEGRYILDAGQWTLASTKFPADARRIVAAVNAVRGIPTDALESWVINVIGDPGGRRGKERRETPSEGMYPNERRVGERR